MTIEVENIEKLYDIDTKFTWNSIRYIDSIDYNISVDETYETYSLLKIGLIFLNEGSTYKAVFEFYNVQNLHLERIGGKYNQIYGFEIVDKSKDGWAKDQRYFVNDYEDNLISFSCESIKVLSVEKKDLYY